MITLTRIIRTLLIVILGCIQFLSFPVTFEEELSSSYSSETETVVSRIDPPGKPLVRKNPSLSQRIILLASVMPIFFVLSLLLLLRLPKPRLPFKPFIVIQKKYLLLLPIKFTSSYLA